MNITKLFTTSDSHDQRDTVYSMQVGETVTFVHESVYDGPCQQEEGGRGGPHFRVLKPEECEVSPELQSFLEAVKSGKKFPSGYTKEG